MSARVLVCDGESLAALAVCRSLVRAGWEVHAGSTHRRSLAGASRGVLPCRLPVAPLPDLRRYAAHLHVAATELDARALLPLSDESVEAVLRWRHLLSDTLVIPFPSWSTWRAATNKLDILARARAAGFAIPDTIVVTTPRAPWEPPDSGFFPAVLKSHRTLADTGHDTRKMGVVMVPDRTACARAIRRFPCSAYPLLLQRRIVGPGEGLFLLRWGGQLLAAFAHRRIREHPPAGGVSTCSESIPLDGAWLEAGRRLLDDLDWTGVAMIECKRDRATGARYIMEVNGRFWGSLHLATDAGVDFPRLLLAAARGERVAPMPPYAVGRRSRWLWGDLNHLLLRVARSRSTLHLDETAGSRATALWQVLKHRPGRDRLAVERWNDPMPGVLEALRHVGLPL